ncbi:AAA family ATPase [candidate division WOR-3 bacterium]|nr:AAA family ATPase [candidate division WOR-3 bacterium]
MHIKEFRIFRYGPLTDSDRVILGDFNLFYGMNEEGKSLTIDAIVKLLLFKKASKHIFRGIDRIDDKPEGYIILENEGNSIKLPDDGDITDFVDLSPEELRNIFIIRNSDLSIYNEETFYTGITDKLTGLKSNKILSVKNKLMEIGKLTRADSGGKLSNREAAEYLETRVRKAEDLIETIEDLKRKAEDDGLDKIEENIEDINEELEGIEMELLNLEQAKKREKYEKGLAILVELKNLIKEINELELFEKDVERNFRDLERDIRNIDEEIEKRTEELKTKEIEQKNTKKALKSKERELRIMAERKRKKEEVGIDVRKYKELSHEAILLGSKSEGLKLLMILSSILLGLSLVGSIIRLSPVFFMFSVIFFGILMYPIVQNFRAMKKDVNLKKLFKKIKLNTAEIDLSSNSIEEILSLIQRFEEEYNEEEKKVKDLEGNVNVLEREIERIKERIKDYEKEKREFEKSVEEIKRLSSTENLREYREKLDRKINAENISREHAAVLKSLFGTGEYSSKDELIKYWDKSISELETYKDKAKGIKYSEIRGRKLNKKKTEFIDEREIFEKKRTIWQDDLKTIERESQEILRSEVYCSTLKEISYVHRSLRDFVYSVEKNVENVLSVMRIFEDIEKEEEEKISRFFGRKSKVSKYFSKITGGRYQTVEIDTEEKNLLVYAKDNKRLNAIELSGGAYDQLYLSIRLALGGELLNTGFFIMDDPFIKSDFKRLKTQMHVLRKIVDEGWQILYFTAKNEVKEAFKKDIANKRVNMIETNWIKL